MNTLVLSIYESSKIRADDAKSTWRRNTQRRLKIQIFNVNACVNPYLWSRSEPSPALRLLSSPSLLLSIILSHHMHRAFEHHQIHPALPSPIPLTHPRIHFFTFESTPILIPASIIHIFNQLPLSLPQVASIASSIFTRLTCM